MFEDDLIVIENSVLCRCKNKMLKILDIPEGTEAIADEVFQSCSGLMAVTLPPTVTKIGDNAFEGCSSLTAVDLSNVNIIGAYAFSGCSSLKKISFSDNIGYLCNGIFLGCLFRSILPVAVRISAGLSRLANAVAFPCFVCRYHSFRLSYHQKIQRQTLR